jgi:hypothetical protein
MTAAGELLPPLRVHLDRRVDRERPCHDNLAMICAGMTVHAAALRCAADGCGAFRGWLPQLAYDGILQWGAPDTPIILQDDVLIIGGRTMQTKKYDNSGILFRCDGEKDNERSRDYRGELIIGGREYWLSGWIKEGRKGKFLGLAVKPKDAPKSNDSKVPVEIGDEIPF